MERDFQDLKAALTHDPVLRAPDFKIHCNGKGMPTGDSGCETFCSTFILQKVPNTNRS